jgi:hypothetical protein
MPADDDARTAGPRVKRYDFLAGDGLTALASLAALDGNPTPLAQYTATLDTAVRDFLRQRHAVYTASGASPRGPAGATVDSSAYDPAK